MKIGLQASRMMLLGLAVWLALSQSQSAETVEPAEVLVSRQVRESQNLRPGDVIALSTEPSGANPRPFRVVGSYEPTADPARLGEAALEARLHLPDLIDLTRDPADPQSAEGVGAINVRLADPGDADAFAREVAARVPGLLARPTANAEHRDDSFVVLDRFHLAIALVTVIASSMFLLALMVMLVDERRETVVILRLIGLRRRRILLQVLCEGTLIALAGAVFGVALAVVLEGAFNRFFQWRYDTTLVFVHVTAAVAARSVSIALPLGVLASVASCARLLGRDALSALRR